MSLFLVVGCHIAAKGKRQTGVKEVSHGAEFLFLRSFQNYHMIFKFFNGTNQISISHTSLAFFLCSKFESLEVKIAKMGPVRQIHGQVACHRGY